MNFRAIQCVTFVLVFILADGLATVVMAREKEIPPWMENAVSDLGARGVYLIPKGAKRKVIGSQVIVEPPNEYVARRLYEMEGYLQKRLGEMEKSQEDLKTKMEEMIEELKGLTADMEGVKEDEKTWKVLTGDVHQLKKTMTDNAFEKPAVQGKLKEIKEGLKQLRETIDYGNVGQVPVEH
jgi:regulator of replication initiation timing